MKTENRKQQLQFLPKVLTDGVPQVTPSRQTSLPSRHQSHNYDYRPMNEYANFGVGSELRLSSALNLRERGNSIEKGTPKDNEVLCKDNQQAFRASLYSGQWKAVNPTDKVPDILTKTKATSSASESQHEKCTFTDCKRRFYRAQLCKQHFIGSIMRALRREMRSLYRGADRAYGVFDFTGVGYISETDFLDSLVCKRVPFSREDIKDFIFQTNAFVSNAGAGMNFDSFKKMFFPHLSQIHDGGLYSAGKDSSIGGLDDEARRKLRIKNLIINNSHHQEEIQNRIKALEKKLKERFSHFDSVRKAFLGLDTDYDGYITVEDILRSFGQENSRDFNFNDLKKLITEKDSSGQGRLGYADFSKWVGNSIHQSEGFYFRHDSVKNPQYEQSQESPAFKNNEKCKKEASRQLINQTLLKTVIEKIKFQWKTIRKAFSDMNKERDSAIAEEELRFYLQHWGLNLNDEQFQHIFKAFDADGDGLINYMDFHNTVGHEIHPGESLYFRQDKPHMMRINKCEHPKCWQSTESVGSNFCELHSKMYIDQGLLYFQKLYQKISDNQWPKFVRAVRRQADRDEEYQQIFFDKFLKVVEEQFSIPVSPKERELLKKTFPGRNEGERVRICISSLYDVNYYDKVNKVYKQVNLNDADLDDVAVDLSGYIGVFHRKEGDPGPKDKVPFAWGELSSIFVKLEQNDRNLKLAHIMRSIKQIDKDNNGYVTSTELDDILKLTFPEELKGKNLKPLFRPFESLQNKILIDYKRFRDRLLEIIKFDLTRLEDKRPSTSIDMKRSQIAEKLQRLRDSKNGSSIASNLSKSFQFGTVRDSLSKSQIQQVNEKSPEARLNRESLEKLVHTRSSLDKYAQSAISKKVELAQATHRMTIDERREHIMQRLNVCRSTIANTSTKAAKVGQSLERKKESSSLLRRSLAQSKSEKDDFEPYQSVNNRSFIRKSIEMSTIQESSLNRKKRKNQGYANTIDDQDLVIVEASKRPMTTADRYATLGHKGIKQKLPKHLEQVRQKLQYEWKGVFRLLSGEDLRGSGIVMLKRFEEVLRANGVFVSSEDLTHIYNTYGGAIRGGTAKVVNYQRLSVGLGLHQSSFNLMRATHTMINKMKADSRQAGLYSSSFGNLKPTTFNSK